MSTRASKWAKFIDYVEEVQRIMAIGRAFERGAISADQASSLINRVDVGRTPVTTRDPAPELVGAR
jgi:hypothetical protein